MNNDRIKNTVRNTAFGVVFKIVTMLGAFASRTMLIYSLGVEYVGLDGLFSSVLSMLNMAELGFGSAIVYKLYKPIAEKDTPQVCALLNYYRTIYRTIGLAVFVVGILLIPYLGIFIKGEAPVGINLVVLYLIYLLNTCCSYWVFAYKSVLLNANNRNDLISKVTSVLYVLRYGLQIVLLLVFKNYYLYAVVLPLITLLTNIGSARICKRYYPDYECRGRISLKDRKEIKTKVTALFFNKIGMTLISASDNVVISSFLGLTVLGIYDSYYYIFSMLYYFFSVFHSAITAGIGNSIVTESKEDNKKIFNRLCFMNSWIVGLCTICLACLYEPFIKLWLGEDKLLGVPFAVLMSIYFYFWMIRFVVLIFKNAQGLWLQDRFRALLEGITNLCLNLLMVRYIGLFGVTLSTIIAMLVVSLPWETRILFKYYFGESTFPYYIKMLKWLLLTVIAGGVTFVMLLPIGGNSLAAFVLRMFICAIVPNLLYLLFYHNSEEFHYTKQLLLRLLSKVKR